ncbi:hypothetical protein KJ708_07825, partial [bacterium]|nr:hypothetical protein [bacterium]
SKRCVVEWLIICIFKSRANFSKKNNLLLLLELFFLVMCGFLLKYVCRIEILNKINMAQGVGLKA